MALKEHDNNIITKQYNDPIIKYLKNIIQRYFEIENEISLETKETIINQAYSRLKEIFNAYNKDLILCINERSGSIDLFIKDFGGEEAFNKNTAFNKSFCDDMTETKTLYDDTSIEYSHYGQMQAERIVEGNDDRLTDARIPITHTHSIDDIAGLREFFEEYNLINGGFHVHKNLNVLNMLVYTGSMVSIDLILFEDLISKVEESIKRFSDTDDYFKTVGQKYINQLKETATPITNKLDYIENNINSWMGNWVRDSKNYSTVKNNSFKSYINNLLTKYLSNSEYTLMNDILSKSIRIAYNSQDIDTSANDKFVLDNIETAYTNSYQATYKNIPFTIREGYTKLSLSTDVSISVSDSNVLNNFYDNKIINSDAKVFLTFSKDGLTYRDQLPHMYQINNSQNDFVYVYYDIDYSNNINVHFRRNTRLPICLRNNLIINAYAEDLSNKTSNMSHLIIDKYDTVNKTNNETQSSHTRQTSDSLTDYFLINKFIADYSTTMNELPSLNAEYNPSGKEILFFTAEQNYSGNFTVTMNTGHWFGFTVSESTDGIHFTQIQSNVSSSNATHNTTPLPLSQNVTFIAGRTYKITTSECPGGGTSSDRFLYTFQVDNNFDISVGSMHNDVHNNVSFNANAILDSNNNYNKARVTYNITYLDGFYCKVFRKTSNETEWTDITGLTSEIEDNIEDTINPNPPRITAKCLSSNNTEEQYDVTFDYSDVYEKTEYKLEVYNSDTNALAYSSTASHNPIFVTSFSGVEASDVHYSIGFDTQTDFQPNDVYELISSTDDQNNQTKHIVLKVNTNKLNTILDNRLLFCDNAKNGYISFIQNYLSNYNCDLVDITYSGNMLNYCKRILLPENDELFEYYLPDARYHIYNSSMYMTTTGTLNDTNDYELNYVANFYYGNLQDVFPNSKISYQLIKIPGKGEPNA